MKNKNLVQSAGGVVIRKSQHKLYIVLLYKNKDWVLPKGRIEKGEGEEQAALREVYEETGIPLGKMTAIKHLGKINYITDQPRSMPKTVSYFLIKTNHQKLTPLKNEGFKKASWFEINEAFYKATFGESKGVILKAIKQLEKQRPARIAVVAIGGRGSRMGRIRTPKLLTNVFGQPFLKFVIDNLLKVFKIVYLLTGYHEKDIKKFVIQYYGNNKKIKIIYGGISGNAAAVYKIRKLLTDSFVYLDGNIICHTNGIKKMTVPAKAVMNLMVSPTSLVNTHLHISTNKNGEIKNMLPLIGLTDRLKKRWGMLCSLGIVTMDHRIFYLIPNFDRFNDLGMIIYALFKTRPEVAIDFTTYNKEWYCLHTPNDVEHIKRNGGNLFSSLPTKDWR